MYPTLWRRKVFLRIDPTDYVSHTVEEKDIDPMHYISHTVEEKDIDPTHYVSPYCGGERFF